MQFTPEHLERVKGWFLRLTPDADIYWPGDGRERPEGAFTWDGKKTLVSHIYECVDNRDLNALHDVAHHLVSEPERRSEVNWGLGPDPWEDLVVRRLTKATVDSKEADFEEALTIRLQFLLAVVLGALPEELEYEAADNGLSELPDTSDFRELKSYLGDSLAPELWVEVRQAAERCERYNQE